jgi:NAD(P)-dependent dehydrogenase (short-subunit alcohol dehydrogenase family)
MPTHLVVGASQGIGYAFLQLFSRDPRNTVIGLVRNVEATRGKLLVDGLDRVKLIRADIVDYKLLLQAATDAASTTDTGIDYLWLNAAFQSNVDHWRFWTDFGADEQEVFVQDIQMSFNTNVIGIINTVRAFLPLVQKSATKKVIALSTGMADTALTTEYGIWEGSSYAVSKAALNMAMAKLDAMYRNQGLLFLSICPGVVLSGPNSTVKHYTRQHVMKADLLNQFANHRDTASFPTNLPGIRLP